MAPFTTSSLDSGNGAHIAQQQTLRQAVLEALIYADLFNYPLSGQEVARYVTAPADREAIEQALQDGIREGRLLRVNGFYALAGRQEVIALREWREDVARRKWTAARRYARWLALLPFVRMIAITGTLAVNNVEPGDDIDLFMVTEPGRLWLARALVIGIVRLVRLAGDELCPNYFLSERELEFPDHSYFSAREVAQMVPLYGVETYWRVRSLNGWVEGFLPQAGDLPRPANHAGADGEMAVRPRLSGRTIKQATEWLLGGRLGAALERWEMQRKVRQLNQEADQRGGSVCFTADCCKGHFDHHDQRILGEFEAELAHYGLRET